MSEIVTTEYRIEISFRQTSVSGEVGVSSKTRLFSKENEAKSFLDEAHQAARIQDQEWIKRLMGQPYVMGPIAHTEYCVSNCLVEKRIVQYSTLKTDIEPYEKKNVYFKSLQHDPNGTLGKGRFSKFSSQG